MRAAVSSRIFSCRILRGYKQLGELFHFILLSCVSRPLSPLLLYYLVPYYKYFALVILHTINNSRVSKRLLTPLLWFVWVRP